MKKLILLGGSAQQTIAIQKAKELGYYTILCDFLSDNPGQFEADKFYLVSTTDRDAVLEVAQKEEVDGIVAYSSDPAAPTAAYVAEKLGLPGVPFDTANSFCNKNLFRHFLVEHGFHSPKSIEITKESEQTCVTGMSFPMIVKPTDSSGSKGVTVIYSPGEFKEARDFADAYSRNHILIAEEYIESDHEGVIECEIFVLNGTVKVWGIMSSIRDDHTNPLIPAAYSYPVSISKERFEIVKQEVSRLVMASKVTDGAFNIEMIINKKNELYFLDAGPRNGGNMLPEYISMINDLDIPKATILTAMGEKDRIGKCELDGQKGGYWGLYVIHADREGTFEGVQYNGVSQYLVRDSMLKKYGDKIRPFENSRDAVGLAFFHFPTIQIRDSVLRDFSGKYIKVLLKQEEP